MHRIKYISFGQDNGYSNAASALIQKLREEGVDVDRDNVAPGSPFKTAVVKSSLQQENECSAVIIHTIPEYFPDQYRKARDLYPRARIWGYTAWETDQIPDHWPALINLLDGVFVPSNWNKEVFVRCGIVIPVCVLPHIFEDWKHADKSCPLPVSDGSFCFYTIGEWSERKNLPALILAFHQEFMPEENVTLVVKTGLLDWTSYKRRCRSAFRRSFGRSAAAFRRLKRLHRIGGNVIHMNGLLRPEQICFLHQRGDCFVTASRGEGWGLGAYEAAFSGNPVIAPAQGGLLDFLPPEHTYFAAYQLIPVDTVFGRESYSANQLWADVDQSALRKLMRLVFEDQMKARHKGAALKEYVHQKFEGRKIAQACLAAIYEKV